MLSANGLAECRQRERSYREEEEGGGEDKKNKKII
jgi:hypothetical protein